MYVLWREGSAVFHFHTWTAPPVLLTDSPPPPGLGAASSRAQAPRPDCQDVTAGCAAYRLSVTWPDIFLFDRERKIIAIIKVWGMNGLIYVCKALAAILKNYVILRNAIRFSRMWPTWVFLVRGISSYIKTSLWACGLSRALDSVLSGMKTTTNLASFVSYVPCLFFLPRVYLHSFHIR